jgi:hypothetical protein
MRLEPPNAHSHSALDRPHISVLARYRDPATPTGPGVVGKYDDLIVACIDKALDLDLEVLVGGSHDGEALASESRTRLHRLARVHVLDIRGNEIPS